MRLNTIYDLSFNRKKRKRVGRGVGSGLGKTCGAGHKGQRARAGVAIKGFEGGQMPINRRLPKRGFNSLNKLTFKVVNLAQIDLCIKEGKLDATNINKADLFKVGLISNIYKPVKLLAKGDLSHKIIISVDAYSKQAQEEVVKLGGQIIEPAL